MSKKKPEITVVVPTTDIIEYERLKLKLYMDAGLPGIGNVTDTQIAQMFELYMEGNTYTQISNIVGVLKPVLLYLAHHNEWYQTRADYLNEVQEKIKNRVIDAKLRSREFVLLAAQVKERRMGKAYKRFLATGDDSYLEMVPAKELDQYLKICEILNNLDQDKPIVPKTANSPLGLNVPVGGMTISKDSNGINIIPNQPVTVGSMLKQMADSARKEEKVLTATVVPRDIDKSNGDKNE